MEEQGRNVSNNFILKWIRLENFRRFPEAEITFESTGFTGITGVNGAGKSSFMIALIYALYGKMPDGSKKTDLRHSELDPKKNPTVVSVGFEHHGQKVEVIRKLSGTNSVASAEVYLDGKQVTVATGSTATDWVTNRLGMDVEGFRTAVVVPQQELNKLVTSLPSERRAIIERLAGIEDLNKAVKRARVAENDLSKVVNVLPGDADSVVSLEQEVESLEETTRALEGKIQTLQGRVDSKVSARSELKEELQSHRDVIEQARDAQSAVEKAESSLRFCDAEISNLEGSISQIQSQLSTTEHLDSEALQSEITSLRETYKELNGKVREHQGRVASLNDTHARQTSNLEQIRQSLSHQKAHLDSLPAESDRDFSEERRVLENELVECRSDILNAQSKRDEMSESIATLRKHSGDAHCPTCAQSLADPDSLISSFETMVSEYSQRIDDTTRRMDDINSQVRRIVEDAKESERVARERERAVQSIEGLEQDERTANDDLASTEKALEECSGIPVEEWESQVQEVSTRGAELAQQVKEVQRINASLDDVSAKQEHLQGIREKRDTLQQEFADAQARRESFGDISNHMAAVNNAEKKVSVADSRIQQLQDELSSLKSEMAQSTTSLDYTRKNLASEKSLVQKKQSKLKQLSTFSATTSLLDEFRKDRISRIAPEISSTATDTISAMTDGAFIEVTVSEDFSTTVTNADGISFPVSVLSGGERSVVALCMRIAIASLISNENSGLMWFDEALSEQDAKRRASILSVLHDLPIQQIIMTNHTHDAEDIVDRTIKIIRDEKYSHIEQQA